jgi:hypothetical protein
MRRAAAIDPPASGVTGRLQQFRCNCSAEPLVTVMSRPKHIAANFSAKADSNGNVEIVDPTVPN